MEVSDIKVLISHIFGRQNSGGNTYTTWKDFKGIKTGQQIARPIDISHDRANISHWPIYIELII